MTKLKGSLAIGRHQTGNGNHIITIRLRDTQSGTNFLDIELTADQFGKCITGLYIEDVDFTLSNTKQVGKVREHMPMKIALGKTALHWNNLSGYDSKGVAAYLEKNMDRYVEVHDGWVLNTTLPQQNSIEFTDEGITVNTFATRFVKIKEAK